MFIHAYLHAFHAISHLSGAQHFLTLVDPNPSRSQDLGHFGFVQASEASEATAASLPSTAQLSAAESLGGLAVARARQKAMAAIQQTQEDERHGGIWRD